MVEDRAIHIVARDLDVPALLRVVAQRAPRVILLDIEHVGDPSGLRNLRAVAPETGVMLLTRRPNLARATTFLAAGAICVSIDDSEKELLLAVRLAAGGPSGGATPVRHLDAPQPFRTPLLTPRETQVFELLRQARTRVQIAHELHIDSETVKTHAEHVYRKLNVRCKRELIALFEPRTCAEI